MLRAVVAMKLDAFSWACGAKVQDNEDAGNCCSLTYLHVRHGTHHHRKIRGDPRRVKFDVTSPKLSSSCSSLCLFHKNTYVHRTCAIFIEQFFFVYHKSSTMKSKISKHWKEKKKKKSGFKLMNFFCNSFSFLKLKNQV